MWHLTILSEEGRLNERWKTRIVRAAYRNRLLSTQHTTRWILLRELGGCVRDIKHVEAFLISRVGMPSEKILKLTATGQGKRPVEPRDQWPTYENMIAKFKQLIRIAEAGDQVYIHYSGH